MPPHQHMESAGHASDLHHTLLNRFRELEDSHRRLQEQFKALVDAKEKKERAEDEMERRRVSRGEEAGMDMERGRIPGYFAKCACWSVLQSIGHAVHVSGAAAGQIIFWNRSAENLYGWKDYEVVGRRALDILVDDENHVFDGHFTGSLSIDQSWSGQYPLRKRSGEVFVAMVTNSPLYEDGELVGIITVSSDAAVSNNINLENLRTRQEHDHGRPREWKLNMKKIQWHPQPQIASSVSNLASKVFSLRHGESGGEFDSSAENRGLMQQTESEQQEKTQTPAWKPIFRMNVGKKATDGKATVFEHAQPSKIAAKVWAKLQLGTDKSTQEPCMGDQFGSQGDSATNQKKKPYLQATADNSGHAARCVPKLPTRLNVISEDCHNCDTEKWSADPRKSSLHSRRGGRGVGNNYGIHKTFEDPSPVFKRSTSPQLGCRECHAMPTDGDRSPPSMPEHDGNEYEQLSPESQPENPPAEITEHHHAEFKQSPTSSISGGSIGSNHTGSNKDGKDPNAVVDCEIHWEDLLLMEEIGHGSYGTVYHGLWNGSDVAVKVYTGNEYHEGIFLDYKKETAIMKRLRHPNVLLFMGAVYSPERLGMVTELLSRGSLFKVLHKSNQALDIRRRLRMALDVARGMNYLHSRNPPIVHRDLKSSNLLVDKNWTVKVGDFGLSQLKNSTFLTAKSGRGTPQWMAPEVIRNEPSNEKSDVYSFGVILWELMTESIPWTQLNSLQVVGVVGFMGRRLDLPEGLDPRISSIINDCWRSDPGERPSFKHILQLMRDATSALVGAPGRKNS